ncbi:TMEM143 family protein [Okeanomitos corallinicola TIOX110]|uniref:TMEM143 family protein n=1 Tax=Okeanomitos corallinicola TIOX110 TaxID=3133117 RepID=A0ABZ2US91_9CYAN
MSFHENLEAFIPHTRNDIIKLCLADGQLNESDAQKFPEFCQILTAYYHFRFHKTLEIIKENYIPFNPNADILPINPPSCAEYGDMELKVIEAFEHIVERANYIPLSEAVIQKALDTKSLIDLKTDVDFADFDKFICYYRGDVYKEISVKKFYFWEEQKKIDIFERIVVLIKFKEPAYFKAKKIKIEDLKFIPGKMYVYFYKDIPKLDIDLLFPNVKTSMTWKDRLLFGIPAIGAAIPLILRTLPNLLLLIAAVLLAFNVQFIVDLLSIDPEKIKNIMPIFVATLSLAITLGGFAFKQYNTYKSKKIKFQKTVTDTLFFQNLGNNASVFQMFIELGEEEECKEIILAYYHLLTSPKPLTPEELDHRIETWMKNKLGTKINFDIQGPVGNLKDICGRVQSRENAHTFTEISLLTYNQKGECQVPCLDDAKAVIDYVWDNAFQYNGIIL